MPLQIESNVFISRKFRNIHPMSDFIFCRNVPNPSEKSCMRPAYNVMAKRLNPHIMFITIDRPQFKATSPETLSMVFTPIDGIIVTISLHHPIIFFACHSSFISLNITPSLSSRLQQICSAQSLLL